MQVSIKDMQIEMDVKNNGVELEVRDNDGTFRGGCLCDQDGPNLVRRQDAKQKSKQVAWDEFINWMNS